MVKKIRIRFSLVIVLAVLAILTFIVVSINLINYQSITNNADDILEVLALNGGQFTTKPQVNDYSPELPFETRYFTVKVYGDRIDPNENSYFANVKNIAAVDEKTAIMMTRQIMDDEIKRGYSGTYRFLVVDQGISTLVIYIDWSEQLVVAKDFLLASIVTSLLALIVVFFLAYFTSNLAMRPILRSNERQSRFIANASHEIKTPLTIISANNELVEIEHGENESTEAITKQIGKLNRMINSLTVLAKFENIKKNNKSDVFDFSNVLNTTVIDYKNLLEKLEVNLSVEDNIIYQGHEGLIHQMICILLDNAIKYSISKLNISLRKVNRKIELFFENDAMDLEQGDLDKYFERFYRSSGVRSTKIQGSGIGLSICKEIVDFHKGTLKAKGEGNLFSVKIYL